MSEPAGPSGPGQAPPPRPLPTWAQWLLPLMALGAVVAIFLVTTPTGSGTTKTFTYSQFLSQAASHHVKAVTLGPNGSATGTLAGGDTYTVVIPPQAGSELLSQLRSDGVSIEATQSGSSAWSGVLGWVLLLVPFGLLLWWSSRSLRKMGGPLGSLGGVGKARAQVVDAERPATTFADVAGYEGAKAEIAEVVDFLRSPERYRRAGAVGPRGVLMVGPPGTGKTLLARAVAGEAAVPFFSVVGSSFVEMFVGVGASRVRDLFAEARKRAPAIVFVDEIDAIGAHRSVSGVGVSNDEREQTLNQLLSEMDGFDAAEGIVVLAATNRPEVLDPALLRPGRFDRQVVIPLPTQSERQAILEVHCRDKQLGPDVDLDAVARGTPGFSGADLANLANEAAINAVRDDRDVISSADFGTARDRILLGRRDGSNVLLPEEKHAVAVHEAGHALAATLCEHADPVEKVTILPAGSSLGVTEQLPEVERHLYGQDYLDDALTVRLGGRVAEVLVLGQASTGAANDLTQATDLATRMVREFGLSERLGPVGYPVAGSVFLGRGGAELSSRPYAEATQGLIDEEVGRLLREAEQRATRLLEAHRPELDALVELLLQRETIDGDALRTVVHAPAPVPARASVHSRRRDRAAKPAMGPVPPVAAMTGLGDGPADGSVVSA
ncbi:MAG TPA: ATP-dependent zinc metalloprotease FtsH [Acidimicrobiales bacterium]|nr:ATP-dependent zinc metalloprotease FtsH [Acidimicrobiales bacterium]